MKRNVTCARINKALKYVLTDRIYSGYIIVTGDDIQRNGHCSGFNRVDPS